MREIVIRVPHAAVEEVLDRLLPIVPGGVHEIPHGKQTELRMRGSDLPSKADVQRAGGRWIRHLEERDVSDDWVQRRLTTYRPAVIADRVSVRMEWAPPAAAGLIDIVLADRAAFGSGTHPTTFTCLEMLLGLPPAGSFADLGCGAGVLAILAAKLGWTPVMALDIDPSAVETALENAAANDVEIDARVGDLMVQRPPATDALAANCPAAVHKAIATALPSPLPRFGVISGFWPAQAAEVLGVYAANGLRQKKRVDAGGWTIAVLEAE